MSEPDLIDRYVADVHHRLRDRADVHEVAAEIEDHLRESAARFVAEGVAAEEAQSRAVERFGDAAVVHRALSVRPSGGVVMPTTFTRCAGVSALVAAASWIAIPVMMWWPGGVLADISQERFTTIMVTVVVATMLTGIAALGFVARLGRPTVQVQEVVVYFAIGSVLLFSAPWYWFIGGLAIGGAFLVPMLLHRNVLGRPSWVLWATVAAWPVGLVTVLGLTVARFGPADQWGDHPLAGFTGLAVTVAILAVGLTSLGLWLATEQRSNQRLAAVVG